MQRPLTTIRLTGIGAMLSLSTLAAAINVPDLIADEPSTTEQVQPYSDTVVEKATAILETAQLRRGGKTLQFTGAAEWSRDLGSLTRQRRDLKLRQNELDQARQRLDSLNQMISNLNRNDRDLNLRHAQIGGNDVAASNRIVALMNATRSQIVETREQVAVQTKLVQSTSGEVNEVEEAYAEEIFQLRQTLDQVTDEIEKQLTDPQVKIAIGVMNRNFDVPLDWTAAEVLKSLDGRLKTFEKEVFRETIDLDAGTSGSLFAMVSINNQPVRMIVDSGSTLVTIPADTASELQMVIPADAPIVNMVLANGQQITGRRVQLATVRVGAFEAKDVDAVVLEPIAGNAQPLLGLSYLDRYKFEINPTAKTLGLLNVVSED